MFPMQYGSQAQSMMMPYSSSSCGCSHSQSNNGVGLEQYINLIVANNMLQFQNMGLYNQLRQFTQQGHQQNQQQSNRDNTQQDGKLKTCEEENTKLKASMQELQKTMITMKKEVTTNTESMKGLLDKANKEKLELINKLKEYESKNK